MRVNNILTRGADDTNKKQLCDVRSCQPHSNDPRLLKLLIITICLIVCSLIVLSAYHRYNNNIYENSTETTSTTDVYSTTTTYDNSRSLQISNNADTDVDDTKWTTTREGCDYDGWQIKCSFLSGGNPGQQLSNYIDDLELEADCYMLTVDNFQFPEEKIIEGWLPSFNEEVIITKLKINSSIFPVIIENNAFKNDQLQYVYYLTIIGNIRYLQTDAFQGLTELQYLDISLQGTTMEYAEAGILSAVPNLLSLEVTDYINDSVLNNITKNATLSKVLTLDIRYNEFETLKFDTLNGFTTLRSLFIEGSDIDHIDSKAFTAFGETIESIHLKDNDLEDLPVGLFDIQPGRYGRSDFFISLSKNKLQSLPANIFDKAILNRKKITVDLSDNKWLCNCNLAWLQELILNDTINLNGAEQTTCEAPDQNKGKTIEDADFNMCSNTSSSTITSVTTSGSITTTAEPTSESVETSTWAASTTTTIPVPTTTKITITTTTTTTTKIPTPNPSDPASTSSKYTTTTEPSITLTNDVPSTTTPTSTTAKSTTEPVTTVTTTTHPTTSTFKSTEEPTVTTTATPTTTTTKTTTEPSITKTTETPTTTSSKTTTEPLTTIYTTYEPTSSATIITTTNSTTPTPETSSSITTTTTKPTSISSTSTSKTTIGTTTTTPNKTTTEPLTTSSTTYEYTNSTIITTTTTPTPETSSSITTTTKPTIISSTSTSTSTSTSETTTNTSNKTTTEPLTSYSSTYEPTVTITTTTSSIPPTLESTTTTNPITTTTTKPTTTSTLTLTGESTTVTTTPTTTTTYEPSTTTTAATNAATTTTTTTSITTPTPTTTIPTSSKSTVTVPLTSPSPTITNGTTITSTTESENSSTIFPPPLSSMCNGRENETNTSFIYFSRETEISSFQILNLIIKEDDADKTLIIKIKHGAYTLFWMNTDNTGKINCNLTPFKHESCSSAYYIAKFKTHPSMSYTLCAVSNNGDPLHPLNCRAHTTLPLEDDRPWLVNDEKVVVCCIFGGAILICLFAGGLLVYLVVRRHPRLIKGNKRVIVVRHRAGDVMVMPKEYYYATKSDNYCGFRRSSETSYYTARTSSTSYVTAIQPTPVQLIAWKFNQMWNRLTPDSKKQETDKPQSNEPPPLPPYPKDACCRASCEMNYPYDNNSCYTTVVTDL